MAPFGPPDPGAVAFVDWLRSRVPASAPVLDAGCGRGRHFALLREAGLSVWACDLSPAAAAMAREDAGARVTVANLVQLPYADSAFAAEMCVHVLPYHRQADLAQAVRELRRVLRPGGWLYFDLLAREDAEYGLGQAVEADTFADGAGLPTHYCSRAELDTLLKPFAVERLMRVELRGLRGTRVAWAVWATRG